MTNRNSNHKSLIQFRFKPIFHAKIYIVLFFKILQKIIQSTLIILIILNKQWVSTQTFWKSFRLMTLTTYVKVKVIGASFLILNYRKHIYVIRPYSCMMSDKVGIFLCPREKADSVTYIFNWKGKFNNLLL